MALSSTRAIYNAAVDTLVDALEAMLEAEPAAGAQLAFVPCEKSKGNAADSHFGGRAGGGVVFNGNGVRRYVTFPSKTDEAPVPLQVGTHPMFWKITNSAGDIT